MALDLVVGCPVRRREWIIEDWFAHVEAACQQAAVHPTYTFVADRDDPTAKQVADLAQVHGRACFFEWCKEDLSVADERTWGQPGRYDRMVKLRNQLLGLVRDLEPAHFLSLDSDILLHPQMLVSLAGAMSGFDAVGGATYMTPTGTQYPSCGWYRGMEGLVRHPMEAQGVVPVGVIMAIKLMGPAAYAVDYEFNHQGEDIGWSLACERAGLTLGWDNRQWSKHVMGPGALGQIDGRCGW